MALPRIIAQTPLEVKDFLIKQSFLLNVPIAPYKRKDSLSFFLGYYLSLYMINPNYHSFVLPTYYVLRLNNAMKTSDYNNINIYLNPEDITKFSELAKSYCRSIKDEATYFIYFLTYCLSHDVYFSKNGKIDIPLNFEQPKCDVQAEYIINKS